MTENSESFCGFWGICMGISGVVWQQVGDGI